MTLALYGKSRRRQGVLVALALFTLFAAIIGAATVRQPETASAATTGILVPTGSGGYSSWTTGGSGSSAAARVNEGTCAAGDTTFIVETSSNDRHSFNISTASIPNASAITQVDIYTCYGGNGNSGGANRSFTPFVRNGNTSTNTDGSAITFNSGSLGPTASTVQSIAVSITKADNTDLEIGVLRNSNEVRVYAIWAVVHYTEPVLTDEQKCYNNLDVNACINLLIAHNGPQATPPGVCGGINANFVLDNSTSISSVEMTQLKAGITSFVNTLGASSQYAGVAFSTGTSVFDPPGPATGGYMTASQFTTILNGTSPIGNQGNGFTFLEGGINAGKTNTANSNASLPSMMFVVTDGAPNYAVGSTPTAGQLGQMQYWVTAANAAIAAANQVRTDGAFTLRVLYTGEPDTNLPFPDNSPQEAAWVAAVMERVGGGSFVASDWSGVASGLLSSAGCDPSILKANGVPGGLSGGKYTYVDWAITIVNTAATTRTTTITDANAPLLISTVPAGACTVGDTNLADGLNCTVPAKVGGTNGTLQLNVRTTLPDYNICTGLQGENQAVATGQIAGTSNTATFTIPANPGAPECLGTIKVVKVEEGGLTATSDTWNFGLSAGPTSKPDISIPNSGDNSFTGLTPGNYTVTELNSQGFVAACTPTVPAGSFVTTSGTTENPQTVGQAVSSIPVVAGQVTTVYFTNTGCAFPDVKIEKTSNTAASINVGANVSFNIKVTNLGPGTATGVVVTDTLQGGIDWNTPNGCSIAANVLTCNLGDLAEGEANAVTITLTGATRLTGTPNSCGVVNNTASVSATNEDSTKTNNNIAGPATVNVLCPNLAITKAPFPSNGQATIGDVVGFDIVVTNNGSGTATNVTVSDQLPNTGLVWGDQPGHLEAVWSNPNTPSGGCSLPTDGALLCQGFNIQPGQSVTIKVRARALPFSRAACITHINEFATVSVLGVNTNSGPAQFTITCPTLSITKTANPAGPVNAGSNIGFDLQVSASVANATNVVVTDTLPSALGVSWSVDPNICAEANPISGNQLSCTLAAVNVGSPVTIHIKGTTTATGEAKMCGVITNPKATATVLGTGVDSGPASVTVNCPDPSVLKSGNGPVTAGDAMVYTITVTAGGTGTQTVTLTDTPPAGVTWTVGGAGVTGQGSCANGAQVTNPASLSCTWENLNPGDTRVITLTATSTPAQCGPNGLTNTATITSAGDVNTNNNESTATIVVNCPNVTLTKTANEPATVSAGEDISFTITATNNGAGAAKDFVLYDVFPGNIGSWTFTNNPDNCAIVTDADPNTSGDQPGVRCPGVGTTTLAANGGSITFTIKGTTTPAACGTVTNTARATASNHPGEITPAQAEVVVRCPDVTVLKVANPATINAGEDAVFNITIDNAGTGVAKNVVLTDTLPGPASLTWSLSGSGATYCNTDGGSPHAGGEVLTCSFGDIAGDATPYVVTLTASTTRDHCGPLANTATVTADNEPANLQPNTSSDTVNVNCADIVFVKSTTTPAISATDVASFKIEVTNPGAGTAFNVVVTDVLPGTGLVWTLGGPDAGSCSSDGSAGHNSGETLTCTFGDMPQGASRSITLTTTTTVGTCPELNNVANLTSSNAGTAQSGAKVVVNCPNITVAKTSTGANPVDAGGDLFYTIDVAVSGPEGTVAKAVILKEDVPANTSAWTIVGITGDPLPAGADCTQILSSIICDFGDLTIPADGQLDFHITLSAKAVGSGGAVTCGGDGLTNWAIVQAGNAPEDRDSATVMVDCPNVTISKTAFVSSISSGDEASFTVQVTNTGAGVAKNVTITDDLGGTGLSWNPTVEASSQDLADTVDCTVNPITGVFICSIPELANGQWVKIHMSATTTPGVCGPIDNVAGVTVGNDGSPEAKQSELARITVNCPDVTVDKEPDNGDPTAAVSAGDDATFVITVRNDGPGTAKNVTLKDQLPLADVLDWTLVGGVPAECSIDANDFLSCSWPSLADGAEVVITVHANTPVGICEGAPEGGLQVTLDNTATVAAANESTEAAAKGNSDTGEITINCSDVQVEKSADETPIGYFDSASFTINVWNNGPGTAYGAKVVDTLPAGVEWDTNDQACEVDNTAGTITCEFDELAPLGGEVTKHAIYVYSLDGEQGVRVCGPLVNSVVVSASNEPESATANNSAEATIDVECGTILVVKIDNVPGNTPNLPANWEFVITGPNGFNEVRTIPSQQGGGVVTIEGVPLGAGYAVTETQAKGACPTTPSDATWTTLANPGTPLDLLVANTTITFTFTNNPCGAVLDTGALIIEKYSDINGNGIVDGADAPLSNWPITVSGPQFAQPLQTTTNLQGRVILPSIQSGNYTVTEGTNPNYAVVGVRVNGGALTASTSTQVQVVFGDEDVVTFYNQPRGSIVVTKSTVISVNNGPNTAAPADADGWLITVSSAACGINLTQATGANGQATFTNLPLCSDYVVSENPVNPASPGYVPAGPTSVTNVTPGHPAAVNFTFVNRKLIIDACTNIADCPQATATPTNTPVPPTNTPAPATATPTNTQVPPSPTPEETVGGERTPGPASPTPQAPDTGAGLLGGPVAGMNLMLLVMGLTALAIGFTFVSIGRRKSSIRR